jgi:DNA (cytosine-5)-methyltransferase 1
VTVARTASRNKSTIRAADLFCGAGGTSTGLAQASERLGRRLDLAAVNHWSRAVETHAKNHPKANHFCEDISTLDPKKAVKGGKLDILVASPACTHHSVARGGKPMSDQSRASAWCVLRWATELHIDRIIVENVPEFEQWGPIGTNGRPLKSRRGETFQAFVKSLESLGYTVAWRVLNAADYGGATTRRRIFVQAVRGRRKIQWPEPTHSATPGQLGLFREPLPKWRAAREVIDWGIRGRSIFGRKRPLSENTLKRIEAGLRKFGGANAEPFLLLLRGTDPSQVKGSARSVDDPVPTVTTSGGHVGVCEPFVVPQFGSNGPRSVDRPLGTITTTSRGIGVCEPYITSYYGNSTDAESVEKPIPTVTTHDRFGLVEPFLVSAGGPKVGAQPVDGPMNTVLTRDHMALVEPVSPYLIHTTHHGGDRVSDVNQPLPTVTTAKRGEMALIQPFVLPPEGIHRGNAPRSVDTPLQTITAGRGGGCVVEPFILPYRQFDGMQVDAISDPMRTITAKNGGCNALVFPDGSLGMLDILFRMLEPHELMAAMGFPLDYILTGNREERVKQIGNAVEVNLARELMYASLHEGN